MSQPEGIKVQKYTTLRTEPNRAKDVSVFKERKENYPSYLADFTSISAEEETVGTAQSTLAEKENVDPLQDVKSLLCSLRLELLRARSGMNDFIIRVATPGNGKYLPTLISIRGNRSMAKLDGIQKLAKVIRMEMIEREDQHFKWDRLDEEHLIDMILPPVKFFATSNNCEKLQFDTEALAEEQGHD